MADYLQGIQEIVSQLKTAKVDVQDGDIIAAILNGLPESYGALIMAMEIRDEADLTLTYVVSKLNEESQRRINAGTSTTSESALQSQSRSGTVNGAHGRGKS